MRHRFLAAIGLAAVASLGLAACGGSTSSSDASGSTSSSDVVTLTVGATPSPHAKILTYINDNLAEAEGIKLDIVEYTDYVQPNTALNDGDRQLLPDRPLPGECGEAVRLRLRGWRGHPP